MLINFNEIQEITVPGMNGGIHAGGSIGPHRHETSDDINYIISGAGYAVCDGKKEILTAGTCHICKKGSEHSITNTGKEDLVMLTVVAER